MLYRDATHSRGVMPMTALKLRKKDASVVNPDADVIATIFMSGWQNGMSAGTSLLSFRRTRSVLSKAHGLHLVNIIPGRHGP